MKTTEIKFTRPVKFLGRNGLFNASGLVIELDDKDVTLTPITSKNEVARCAVEIPREDIPKLIAELKELW